jgi:hypothetical protein
VIYTTYPTRHITLPALGISIFAAFTNLSMGNNDFTRGWERVKLGEGFHSSPYSKEISPSNFQTKEFLATFIPKENLNRYEPYPIF